MFAVLSTSLAHLLDDQGKLDEAEPLFREVLSTKRHILGGCHPDTLLSIDKLAHLLRAQGKLNEAESLHRELLSIRREVFGDHHPDTLTSIISLALLLSDQERYDEANMLFSEASTTRRQILSDQGKFTEAGSLFEESAVSYSLFSSQLVLDDHCRKRKMAQNFAAWSEENGQLQCDGQYRTPLQEQFRLACRLYNEAERDAATKEQSVEPLQSRIIFLDYVSWKGMSVDWMLDDSLRRSLCNALSHSSAHFGLCGSCALLSICGAP